MPRPPNTPRPPLAEVSPNSRSKVCGARAHWIPYSTIGRVENLTPSTCRQIVKNANHQTSCISQPRSGRPSKLDVRDERHILRVIAINPKITAAQLVAQAVPHVTKKTVYRFLKKSGIQKWRCKKRPLLTPERAAARLAWAMKHDGKPLSYWKRWRWSDECSVERGKGGKWDFVYRRRGEALEPWAVQGDPTKGKTTMFWAAFGWGIRTNLIVMKGDPNAKKGGVTARRYVEVLEEYLPTILDYNSIFMQDNAPIHKAHLVVKFFEDMGIEVVDWPPYSPDLNPIENLWKMMKAKIIELYPEMVSMKDNDATKELLIQAASEAWELLEVDMLNKLAEGMQKRVDAVKAAGGWYTKY